MWNYFIFIVKLIFANSINIYCYQKILSFIIIFHLCGYNIYWKFIVYKGNLIVIIIILVFITIKRSYYMEKKFFFLVQNLPVEIRRPSPSHGLKNLYSVDLSMYTLLERIISTSRGSIRQITNLGPTHILTTSLKFSAFFSTWLNMAAIKKIRNIILFNFLLLLLLYVYNTWHKNHLSYNHLSYINSSYVRWNFNYYYKWCMFKLGKILFE